MLAVNPDTKLFADDIFLTMPWVLYLWRCACGVTMLAMLARSASLRLLISEKSSHGRHNVVGELTEKHADLAVGVPV